MRQFLTNLTERARRSAFALPLAVAVAVLLLVVNESAYRGARAELGTAVQMGRARLATYEVIRYLTEAESNKRGYMLTGRERYLENFEAAASATEQLLVNQKTALAQLGQGDTMSLHKAFTESAYAKLSELRTVLNLERQGHRERARDLMLSDIGREHMEAARSNAEALIQAHNQHIVHQLDEIFNTLQLNRVAISMVTILALLVLAKSLRQTRTLDNLRQERELALRAERDRLEAEVFRRTTELTELTRHLQTAREDEKARLARDLHDELGALLTAAKLDVARMRPTLARVAPELQERVVHLTQTLNSGISLKRRIIEDLRPSTLDNLGLRAALEVLCSESADRLGLPIRLSCDPPALTRSAELTVFRLVQEALTNVAKHAQARQVDVLVATEDGQARVQVADDGAGFDPALTPQASHGLLGMRYRVASEGGRLGLHSAPGKGTRVTAWLPVAAA